MMSCKRIFAKIERGEELASDELRRLLLLPDPEPLFAFAYAIKLRELGPKVRLRGLIELSNICKKDCYYCGIRASNREVERYLMSDEQVLAAVDEVLALGFGSLVIQAGEQSSPSFISRISRLLRAIKKRSAGTLGITLSLGEQTRQTYQEWFAAGAHRYLLRMESFSPTLYSRLHPVDHSFRRRLQALSDLRQIGYQVGTGVMIALPWQSADDLVTDLLALRQLDVDMVGMGPYLPHADAPLAELAKDFCFDPKRALDLGLRMIALTRILLPDSNIAATTALQTLATDGREQGLLAGANVIMPNVSLAECKSKYQLYEGKPGQDELCAESMVKLSRNIESIGEQIVLQEWGDSPHFYARKKRAE